MFYMTVGLLLWSIIHLVPSLGQKLKKQWTNALGENGYKASFSILILIALALIVLGWRSATPSYIYALPDIVRPVAMLLMVLAFLLFGAANYPTRIKRIIRHPQLTGVVVWSAAHLLVNGDSRSVLLFGWLGIWAMLEMLAINRREGQWIKEAPANWTQEAKGVVISLLVFIAFVFAHPYIAGVPIT